MEPRADLNPRSSHDPPVSGALSRGGREGRGRKTHGKFVVIMEPYALKYLRTGRQGY